MADFNSTSNVLIVDDDQSVRNLMKHALSSCDVLIEEAESGEQALELCRNHLPTLILLDVNMPGIGGLECCRQLRTYPKGQEVTIVIFTSSDYQEDITEAFSAGASEYITKPIKWSLFEHRIRNILKASQTANELLVNKNKLSKAQFMGHLGWWEWDFESRNILCSDELYSLLGFNNNKIVLNFLKVFRLVDPDDRPIIKHAVRELISRKKPYDIEYRILSPDGSVITLHEKTDIIQEGERCRAIGTIQDISNYKKTINKVEYYTNFDYLTDLPNRRFFIEQLRVATARAERYEKKLCLAFIDLDNFTSVNDSFGSEIGDELLCKSASRIKECIRLYDTFSSSITSEHENSLARLGDDEFSTLICEMDSIQGVSSVAQRIINSFKAPFIIREQEIYVTLSIGLSIYPDDAGNDQALLQCSHNAMKHAKSLGKNNYQFYSEKLNSEHLKRLSIESDLRAALYRQEFELFYQPQINTKQGKVIGFEALVRWNHPTRGVVMPNSFIEIAERSGLIIELGDWILNQACQQAKAWQERYKRELKVAVNLSGMQFNHPLILEKIKSALNKVALQPYLLELEITESSIVSQISNNISVLYALKKIGVSLAIDDFGTGYSSLSYLKNFPVDILKIDKSFVDEVTSNTKDAAIVQTIIQLANNLELKTIAEGIESIQQEQKLSYMGCENFQGYLYSRPLPLCDIEKLFFHQS